MLQEAVRSRSVDSGGNHWNPHFFDYVDHREPLIATISTNDTSCTSSPSICLPMKEGHLQNCQCGPSKFSSSLLTNRARFFGLGSVLS